MVPMTIDHWRRVPATLVILACGLAGFLVYLGGFEELLARLTFTDFRIRGQHIVFISAPGEYWRFLTPIFLHFGWLHIVFNSLWTWELGGKLELTLGPWVLALLVVVIGVGSNSVQYYYGGPSLFGGLSGVVFGLLGFNLVYGRLQRVPLLALSNGLVIFMIGWLVFCMIGPTEALGFGSIANAAHLSGLVLGCLFGLLAWGIKRL